MAFIDPKSAREKFRSLTSIIRSKQFTLLQETSKLVQLSVLITAILPIFEVVLAELEVSIWVWIPLAIIHIVFAVFAIGATHFIQQLTSLVDINTLEDIQTFFEATLSKEQAYAKLHAEHRTAINASVITLQELWYKPIPTTLDEQEKQIQ